MLLKRLDEKALAEMNEKSRRKIRRYNDPVELDGESEVITDPEIYMDEEVKVLMGKKRGREPPTTGDWYLRQVF